MAGQALHSSVFEEVALSGSYVPCVLQFQTVGPTSFSCLPHPEYVALDGYLPLLVISRFTLPGVLGSAPVLHAIAWSQLAPPQSVLSQSQL